MADYRDVEDYQRLAAFLVNLRDTIIATFESYEIDIPARRIITMGLPPYDCEQLTVSLIQMYYGLPGAQAQTPQRCDGPITAVVAVQVLRAIPLGDMSGNPPKPEDATNSVLAQVTDAWALMRSLAALDEFGLGVIADVVSAEPQGGYDGPVLTLTMAVP
jgi:hypothetical protein